MRAVLRGAYAIIIAFSFPMVSLSCRRSARKRAELHRRRERFLKSVVASKGNDNVMLIMLIFINTK